jgi:hypothetical protein
VQLQGARFSHQGLRNGQGGFGMRYTAGRQGRVG